LKRREFIRHLEAHGCPFKREGGDHSIYWNPSTGRREPIPRHSGTRGGEKMEEWIALVKSGFVGQD
jgi:predicted RNA binding protein YcfA (HicA-like mRNA interferase family)